ncbi:proton-coupled folate transporter [Amyelois transitella]|uniref:proton-coupled folate transporter n=1 Tax=Amyelois transitella TaxID=680683 RepID=UPI00298F586F|nr:proton-coupled folate transporter [Amyelois transitella]
MADEKRKEIEADENPLNKNVTEIIKTTKTFKEKLRFVRDNITVEPLLAGLIIPSVISRFAMVNLNLDKACRVNLNFSSEICDTIIQKTTNSNYSEYEKEVQKLISSIDIWKSVIHTAIPCIIIMFLGAWSDRTGKRKIVIMLPIMGEIVTSISNLINVYFFYEIPVEVTVFLETIFPAITGGWVTMFLGVFSYISDITDEESRTFRVGLVNFCMTAGLPIGIGVGGILVQRMGYYGIFSMTSVMFVVVAIYGLTRLDEPDQFLKKKGLPPIERPDCKDLSFFHANHVIETVAVAYKKRPSRRRLKIILTLFTVFIVYGPSMSEHTIFYLFVRNTLSWDMVKYSLYTSYSIILHSFGAMFGITVLSKRLQMDDSLLCLISVVSKFGGSIWTAFVRTDLEMYLVPVVEILNGTIFTSLRSIVTKQVDKQETAKMNSLFSLTETLAALMFHPLYSLLYMKTLHVLPGAVFLTSAALLIPAFIILITFYVQHRIDLRNARKKALEAEDRKEDEVKKNPITLYNPDVKPNVDLKTDVIILPNIDLLDTIKKET